MPPCDEIFCVCVGETQIKVHDAFVMGFEGLISLMIQMETAEQPIILYLLADAFIEAD
jgi:hypothetical protein